jgi:hypothetical protein
MSLTILRTTKPEQTAIPNQYRFGVAIRVTVGNNGPSVPVLRPAVAVAPNTAKTRTLSQLITTGPLTC